MYSEPPHFPLEPVTDRRYRAAQRVTWISVWVNLLLTLTQIGVGLLAHAQSLVADGFHSLSDLLADFLVLFANYHGRDPADENHPYGHQRIETAASLGLGLLLVGTGTAVLWTAAMRVQSLNELPPISPIALWAALITLVAKESLFRYMLRIGEQLRSPMLIANAWHARSDALSSAVVALSIGGSLLGYRFLDPIGAVLVGFLILRAGAGFSWNAIRELIDTSISKEEIAAIRATILATSGVKTIHALRTRRMAHKIVVDVHVRVDPHISVSEGQVIAEIVRLKVHAAQPDVHDLLVQVDAIEDDECAALVATLPNRDVLEAHLHALCDGLPADARLLLHFLGARVEADILLPARFGTAALGELDRRLQARLKTDSWFAAIRPYIAPA